MIITKKSVSLVNLKIKHEFLDSFISLTKIHANNCLNIEQGCLEFHVMHKKIVDNDIFLLEIYESEEAHTIHRASQHLKEFLEKVTHMIDEKNIQDLFEF